MHSSPIDLPDNWVLQEKVVYTFQKTQLTRRLPHLKRQHQQQDAITSRVPDIVLLSLWPQATSSQILHYSIGYRTLYPASKIVLLHNNASTFSKNNELLHNTALDDLIESRSGDKKRVLLHLFGSSGASGACKLLRGYRRRTGMPLNVGAVIADAEPSPSITTLFEATQPISSAFFTVLLAFWITLQQYMCFWPAELHPSEIHQDLNNPLLLPKEARKCFIFAQRGFMLTWMKHGLSKANLGESCTTSSAELYEEQDERRTYAIRRSSIDQKGRWSGDQERYWSGIEGVWDGR